MTNFIIEVADRKTSQQIFEFQKTMAYETEKLVLDDDTLKKGIEKIFANPNIGTYYVAYSENKIIGCLLTLFEWSDWRNANILWIHSVYVLPEYRQIGVFKRMYEFIKNISVNDKNIGGIRLYVDKNNVTAENVYQKLGMNKNHYNLYEWLK